MLQTRKGKRTADAAVRAAVEMAEEQLIDRRVALTRVEPVQLEQLLHPRLDPNVSKEVIARGLPASPGAVYGEVVFSADEAVVVQAARPSGDSRADRDFARGHPWDAGGGGLSSRRAAV